MVLVWTAEQMNEITTETVDLEFLLNGTNVDRGVLNLNFVLQQLHTTLHCRQLAEESVGGMMETAEMICRQQQEGNETFCGRSFLLDVLSSDTPSGIGRWESYVSRNEKKLKDKLEKTSSLLVWKHWCRKSLRSM